MLTSMRSGGSSSMVGPKPVVASGKRMKRPALLNFSGWVDTSMTSACLVIAQNGR